MAVFTELDAAGAEQLLGGFCLGRFVALEPISSGIENTNYFLDTDRGRWVLTLFERLSAEQLPFYLELCEHLAQKGVCVACPQRGTDGRLIHFFRGKPFAIANRLAGQSVREMGTAECVSMGRLLAQMHLAARDFPVHQNNLRDIGWIAQTAPRIQPHVSEALFERLSREIAHQQDVTGSALYRALPASACHCDLFRDNALISRAGTPEACVSGVFDFYFAGCTPWLYDLAVTVNDWCIDPDSGLFDLPRAQAFVDSYDAVRPLSGGERQLWRDMLRLAALRFWTSRLFDFYCPRSAALLKPHDPTHFERVLIDRQTCALPWPSTLN